MSDPQRLSRGRAKADQGGRHARPAHAEPATAGPAAPWAAGHLPAPFGLGGVQRKVHIGPAGDAYEREADRVSADVASGRAIAPSAISPLGALGPVGQRAGASGRKPEQDRKPEPERKPEAEKKEKKTDDKPPAMPVQKAAAPPAAPGSGDQKKDPKKDQKKEAGPKPAPVQKAAAPGSGGEKPPDKKPADKKPADKKPPDKKGETDKKKSDAPKPAAPAQKAPAASAPQASDTPKVKDKEQDKKKTTGQKVASAPVQRAAGAPAQAPSTPKKKDREKEQGKTTDEKLAAAPVQRAPAPAATQPAAGQSPAKDKKKEEKKEEKKPEPKPAAAPVQKAEAPASSSAGAAEDKAAEEARAREQERDEDAGEREAARDEEDETGGEAATEPGPAAGPAQRAGSAAPTPSMESAATEAVQSRGAGEPMQAGTRQALESRMGVDLGGVRVHEDSAARRASEAIQARAFTHGQNIWLGPGESQTNLPLMAHEAAHVVQQAGGVHRMVVQRAKKKGKEGKPAGTVDVDAKTVDIDDLHIPTIKGKFPPKAPHTFKRPQERTNQKQTWRKNLQGPVKSALEKKLEPLPGVVKGTEGAEAAPSGAKNKTYFLQMAKGKGHASYLIGTAADLTDEFVIPRWGPNGNPRPLDVDHKTELQLGGDADKMSNFWLLDASANRSSGAKISNQIRKSIASAVAPEVGPGAGKGKKGKTGGTASGKPPTWKATPSLNELIDQKFTVTAKKITADLPVAGEGETHWERDEIEKIEPLTKLKALTVKEAVGRNLVGEKTQLLIYPLPTGGKPRKVKWDPTKETQSFTDPNFLKGYQPQSITYNIGGGGGSISGIVFPNSRKRKIGPQAFPLTLKMVDLGGLPYTATIAPGELRQGMKFAVMQGLSNITFDDVGVEDPGGLVARGKLAPSVPFLKKLDLDILITGEDVSLSKTFTKDDFSFPGPFKVTGASLTVAVGTSTLSVSGDVFFEIERVGKGSVEGKVGTAGGLELKGGFDFDSDLFDPARITVGYAKDKLSGSGEIGIKPGKVKGIKSASLKASFDGDKINASGSVKPSIPGIEQGDLSFAYDPATGIVIGGKLQLKKDIPGIEGGSVTAELAKRPGDDRWKVKASGEATPKIPGFSTKLAVSYDDGAFDVVATAGYEKGMLKGSVTVGATNRPVGADGKPAGPPPDKGDTVTVYGGGSVTLKLAPWLQATAGIRILPNAEIEVSGEIGLPSVLEIFPEKKLDKNIFTIGLDIPIVGVAVAGQRIGIFANISGGLDLSAGIGPGQLQQLKLTVTYNPAHEENTTVTGDASLHVPAHAGLRLFVRGSLGVGIPIVSASAGLEIGGSLGLEGALDAGVHVNWTPTKGLDLTAKASIFVEPKFKFDVTGFVLVEADLWVTTIELYSKRWQLASFEYGSGLRFGVAFPIHYQEGHPFDLSLDDVEFTVPKVNASDLLSGLVKKIA